ncbi:MAG: 1-(5-phosphoribosyl)-5-[(5-phosphoribosylamino)methylideneamino] imidazole-4-carboxamide isomerase [Acidobacteriaceae bacterium]|jgi:phosphoribosylformimino-5-aminoimidazole carboxamide ribotide isomerase|nr:1-(5-phosphoribosyl)-5-[(5-phosphoribosylamino)methylideneamino] imidazole-4-carboxamide isomerase [Acidobacteriaceae bacterium]
MLIPSVDLMGGKIVQLVQGKRKVLEFDDFEVWASRFSTFPLVQLIDLDAAMGRGSNSDLIEFFVKRLPCQVGGGIRSLATAREMLDLGAQRVILGSALIQDGKINIDFAKQLASGLGESKLVFGIDAQGGKVAIRGWREITAISPLQMIQALDPFCCAFLYTHIDTEGLMTGLPLEAVRPLRQATSKQLIVAGGVATFKEIEHLDQLGVDAVVGMALYSGRLTLPVTIPISK